MNEEYEYSFKVKDINPFVNYCEDNNYNLVNDEVRSHINKAISVSNNERHHYLVNYIGKDNL